MPLRRRLFLAGEKGFWAASVYNRYELGLYDPSAEAVRVLRRSPTWFHPYEGFWSNSPDRPAPPVLLGAWQDADGLVWTLTRIPDPHWREAVEPYDSPEGRRTYLPTDQNRAYDTMIEVIDPGSAEVVHRERHDAGISHVMAPGIALSGEENEDGTWRMRIVELILSRR